MTEPSAAERYAAARRRANTPQLTQFGDHLDFFMDDFQQQACAALEEGRNVLVAAPTGAGKTVVGEFAVHLGLVSGTRTFYTTPIKALSNQKYADLVRRYGADEVGLLTGDVSINGDAPVVVMTTEVLRNMIYADARTVAGLGFVVMDEVHYLADRSRGVVWEEVIIGLPDHVRLVSLSATVSNAEEFGDWLTTVRGDTAVIVSEIRPVPLGQSVLVSDQLIDLYAGHVDPTDPGPNPPINPDLLRALRNPERGGGGRRSDRPRRGPGTAAVVRTLAKANLLPAIVFLFSRAGCQAAVDRSVGADVRLTTAAQEAEILQIASERMTVIEPQDRATLGVDSFLDALGRGVAAHHAGMLPVFKQTVEELFAAGLIKVVFATETLALGINMPARSVVLEQLVKWDGKAMTALTPGEYTQLTGRAGRRGIDSYGYAVVLARPELDPVTLAGLASRRLYPLRSSFTPTYNMSVNLVAQVGQEKAVEVLQTSFAQYQADQAVVAQAGRVRRLNREIASCDAQMVCHLGDLEEYDRLRREISRRQKRRGEDGIPAQIAVGDVLMRTTRRRPVAYLVLDAPQPPRQNLTLLAIDGKITRVSTQELHSVQQVGTLPVPANFNPRTLSARRALGEKLRKVQLPKQPDRNDDDVNDMLRQLRRHPSHRCPEKDLHLQWATQRASLQAERDRVEKRVSGSRDTVAATFSTVVEVLVERGYLAERVPAEPDLVPVKGVPQTGQSSQGRLEVTPAGRMLRSLYTENDLLLAECLRGGVFTGLDAAAVAGVLSAIVYRSRREDTREIRIPGGPEGRLGLALLRADEIWRDVSAAEKQQGLPVTDPLDLGLVEPIHRWARGRSLSASLKGSGLEPGDFVRWAKQVIDVSGQISRIALEWQVGEAAAECVTALRRGVVGYDI